MNRKNIAVVKTHIPHLRNRNHAPTCGDTVMRTSHGKDTKHLAHSGCLFMETTFIIAVVITGYDLKDC